MSQTAVFQLLAACVISLVLFLFYIFHNVFLKGTPDLCPPLPLAGSGRMTQAAKDNHFI